MWWNTGSSVLGYVLYKPHLWATTANCQMNNKAVFWPCGLPVVKHSCQNDSWEMDLLVMVTLDLWNSAIFLLFNFIKVIKCADIAGNLEYFLLFYLKHNMETHWNVFILTYLFALLAVSKQLAKNCVKNCRNRPLFSQFSAWSREAENLHCITFISPSFMHTLVV